MQLQNSERFFVIGLSCIVDNGLCSALASSHGARNPYVAFFIHNARQAAVWKIAIRNICKAIEQLDDQITDLVTRVKKLEGKS